MANKERRGIWGFLIACIGVGRFDDPEPARAAAADLSWRHFITKVRGVNQRNPDGSYRQRVVQACRRGERLMLVREPDNPVDPCAIKVCRMDGFAAGYVRAETAEWLHQVLDRGERYRVVVRRVVGGGKRGHSFGLIIELTIIDRSWENVS